VSDFRAILALFFVFYDISGTPLLSPELDIITNITSAPNMNATFEFKAIAYPKPTFKWFKHNGSSWNILIGCKKCKTKQNELQSSLTIIDINENDYGCYKLKIQNEVGYLEQLYFLQANGKCEKRMMIIFRYMLKIMS
jgi:hypothetical protein